VQEANHPLCLDFNPDAKDRHLLDLCYCKYPQNLITARVYPQTVPVAIPRISFPNKLVVSLSIPRTCHKRLYVSLFELVAHLVRFPSGRPANTKQGVGEMKEFR